MEILLVEDDVAIADSIVESLHDIGAGAHHCVSGGEALEVLARRDIDCVLLDLGLPDIDGTDLCQRISETNPVPIIVISARSEESDRIRVLEMGADDYLVKPFGVRELVARITAVRRRHDLVPPPPPVRTHDRLRVDLRTHSVTVDGAEVHLTPTEFEILAVLLRDPGAVLTRGEIIRDVWQTSWVGGSKSLEAHIAGLRKKLGDPAWVVSVRGIGYQAGIPQ